MDFDFDNLEFTGTFDNLIASGVVSLTIFVIIVIISAVIRARLVGFLKKLKKRVNKAKKDIKAQKKADKKAKKQKKPRKESSPAPKQISLQSDPNAMAPNAGSILEELPDSSGKDFNAIQKDIRNANRARSMSSASSVSSVSIGEIDIDALLSPQPGQFQMMNQQGGGNVAMAKAMIMGQFQGFVNNLDQLDNRTLCFVSCMLLFACFCYVCIVFCISLF